VRGVLLDLYDTLVWTEWPLLRERLARALGVSPRDLMRGFVETREARGVGAFGSPEGDLTAVLRAAGGSMSAEQVLELTALENHALAESGIHLYEDSLPVLRELRRRGIPTAIVSNCDHWTRPVVDELGLEDEVDAVVLSFEAKVLKPDPRIYEIALERIGAEATGSTLVDDQPEYLDGAAALGMTPVRIVRRMDTAVVPPGPYRVIEDLWAGVAQA
jgi:HAD superfamily hydrolase (TIGR01509 family)